MDSYLAKIDSNGTLQWIKQNPGTCACSVAIDQSDNIWVNSYENVGVNKQYLHKYDPEPKQVMHKKSRTNSNIQDYYNTLPPKDQFS